MDKERTTDNNSTGNLHKPPVSGSAMSITPKGVILLALGGYVGDSKGLNTKSNTAEVVKFLNDYMKRANCAIMSDEKELHFINIKSENKKWWKILSIAANVIRVAVVRP